MPLVATPENPIPPGAVVETVKTVDGVELRAAWWPPIGAARGTVAIFGGRAEFIEKYFETIQQLLDRGFAVAMLDWRGQGGSARPLKNRRKGHIDDFSLFERDLAAFTARVLGPSCPKPWFGLCHSMGAAIMLMIARSGRCPFERLVLTSPMIRLANLKYPALTRGFAAWLDALGLGGSFAPGGGSKPVGLGPFEGNPLTSDRERFARMQSTLKQDDSLALGWPTVGWIHAAFRLMRQFEDPDFPRAVTVPTLVVAAGADRVTDARACERFSERLRAGKLIMVDGAQHEILIERDIFRDAFWAAFDAYIPGVEGARA